MIIAQAPYDCGGLAAQPLPPPVFQQSLQQSLQQGISQGISQQALLTSSTTADKWGQGMKPSLSMHTQSLISPPGSMIIAPVLYDCGGFAA